MRSLHAEGSAHVLPVVDIPTTGDIVVTDTTVTITIAPGIGLMTVIPLAGVGYIWLDSTGAETLPSPWPPVANATATAKYVQVAGRKDFSVQAGEIYRLRNPAGSQMQVFFQ